MTYMKNEDHPHGQPPHHRNLISFRNLYYPDERSSICICICNTYLEPISQQGIDTEDPRRAATGILNKSE
ncbi:hypothetical protein NC653_006441 [Populus alba x Populus x berolinensis]|uniref:Uncharacterized protein n=1 Tax=Populus alba x Populus x berolinensis TaxID=444605 RepID=A0AAD6RFD6_9ROSI|nr:hypothetical protein NC653_006441 [Populus alba x Populus x berolinensis]